MSSHSSPGERSPMVQVEQAPAHKQSRVPRLSTYSVLLLTGLLTGLLASAISIVSPVLSDLKSGYCRSAAPVISARSALSSDASQSHIDQIADVSPIVSVRHSWWLSKEMCCFGLDSVPAQDGPAGDRQEEVGTNDGTCANWYSWSTLSSFAHLGIYLILAVVYGSVASYLVRRHAPAAAGSGIPEIKTILAGAPLTHIPTLAPATLLLKALTLPLVIASGLSVGKEGPSVHVASALGSLVATWFPRTIHSERKRRQVITAASAAGVAVAFGSPIAGVLFSIEEMAPAFTIKSIWHAFICALAATVTLSAVDPFRTGRIVLFQVEYDRNWHSFEILNFIILGIFGGIYGSLVIKGHLAVQTVRRKYLSKYGNLEVALIAGFTALVCFPSIFLSIDMTESMSILFKECQDGGNYFGLCLCVLWPSHRMQMVASLAWATIVRSILVVISYGLQVPAGIFVPSMAIGATFGRMLGIISSSLQQAFPDWFIFSACRGAKECITPGTYALLGAAATLSGIMRITITVVIIMYELTGALTYVLPTMITILATKMTYDLLNPNEGGIAEQTIRLNRYPFLEDHYHPEDLCIRDVMRRDVKTLHLESDPAGMDTLLQHGEEKTDLMPVVRTKLDPVLIGVIHRQAGQVVTSSQWNSSERNTTCIGDYIKDPSFVLLASAPLGIAIEMFKKTEASTIFIIDEGLLVGSLTLIDVHDALSGQNSPEKGVGTLAQRLDSLVQYILQR